MNNFRTIKLMIVCYCLTAKTNHAQTSVCGGRWDLNSIVLTTNRVIIFKPDE